MLDSKFMITLVGLVAAIFVVCKFNFNGRSTKENFLMHSLRRRLTTVTDGVEVSNNVATQLSRAKDRTQISEANTVHMQTKGGPAESFVRREDALRRQSGGSTVSSAKLEPFHHYPAYQANLSPRTNIAEGYSSIHRGLPAEQHRAVSSSGPLFKDLVSENYCGSCSASGCSEGFTGAGASHAEAVAQAKADPSSQDASSSIAHGDLTQYDASTGGPRQVYTHDMMIYATRNNRLRSQGDPIRGDLPIVPCNTGWFHTFPKPSEDLHQGALNAMVGIDNHVNRDRMALQHALGSNGAMGGIDASNHLHATHGVNDPVLQVTSSL